MSTTHLSKNLKIENVDTEGRNANKINNREVSTEKCRQFNPDDISSNQFEKCVRNDFRRLQRQKKGISGIHFSKNGKTRINLKDLILDCSKLSQSVFGIAISEDNKVIKLGFMSDEESALKIINRLVNVINDIKYITA
ncbi:MAG: hypothetical protein AB1410_01325 [Acidobacteriota bacterium]